MMGFVHSHDCSKKIILTHQPVDGNGIAGTYGAPPCTLWQGLLVEDLG
jgi:hypothetical protein